MFTNWRSRKSQRGAAALEFAIIFPVLLVMLVGIVDFGLVMGAVAQVSNAAREGARAGALTGSQAQAEGAATSAIAGMPGATEAGTDAEAMCTTAAGNPCSMTDATPDTGSMITVTITYVHTWMSPVVLGFSPTITLRGQSMMRIEA